MAISKSLYKYIGKYKILLFCSILFSLLYSLLRAFFISLIQPLFDRIIFFSSSNNTQLFINTDSKSNGLIIWLLKFVNNFLDFSDPYKGITQIGILIFIIALLKGIIYFLQYFFSSIVGQFTIRDIRQDLYKHLLGLNIDYFSKQHTGTLLSNFTYDLTHLEQAISKGTRDIFINISQILIFFMILFGLDWKLTLIVLLFAPFIIFPITKLGNKVRSLTKELQNRMASINIILQETITGVRVVRAFNMEEHETRKFKEENEKYLNFVKKIAKITSLQVPIVETVFSLISVGILGYGGIRILEGHLTPGEFFMYFSTLFSVTPCFGVLSRVYGIIQAGMVGLEKVDSIFDIKPTISDDAGAIEYVIKKEINFNHVNFGYEPNNLILKDINLNIKKGEMLAIVGPSGAGKSTLVNLLLHFYNPVQGKIEIDGIDISKIQLFSLRHQMGFVTQEVFLFHDTVENNIRYAKPEASFEEIKKAAEKAYAIDFIEKLSSGFQTLVGERGMQLSGGERQRLSIARVILKNPPILILDEATSSLDIESEQKVQKALNNLFEDRTTIVIAHRLSTIRNANRIVVIDKGLIQDIGSHDELIKRSELYQELYKLQLR